MPKIGLIADLGVSSTDQPKWRRRRPGRIAVPIAIAASLPWVIAGYAVPTPAGAATPKPSTAAPTGSRVLLAADVSRPAGAPGQVGAFGQVEALGNPGVTTSPTAGIAATPTGLGYWLVGADGGIFSFGDAQFYGSTGAAHLSAPIVGIAATPTGLGYWLVGADGGIFSFGDAQFYGSTGAAHLSAPIVGIAATPTGHGYWLVGADGGIFSFGDAQFYGSEPTDGTASRVVGIAPNPEGTGYWLPTAAAAPAVTVGASLGTFMVTCYDLPGDTATGVPVNAETVAVDPSVIPLGTRIVVDGAGERIAEDTGGAIIGHHIDIWEPTYADCVNWGVQQRQVWLEG